MSVTCASSFLADTGAPLAQPFSTGTVTSRTDTLGPGQSLHIPTAPLQQGWAQTSCTGAIQASVLYRYFQKGAAAGESGVNASTVPATKFATFSEINALTSTAVAVGNPSSTKAANVTLTAVSSSGVKIGTISKIVGPLAHFAATLGPLLGNKVFTGYVQVTSDIPVVSMSLNAEAFPSFSSLPPGALPAATLFAVQ